MPKFEVEVRTFVTVECEGTKEAVEAGREVASLVASYLEQHDGYDHAIVGVVEGTVGESDVSGSL